MSNKGIRVHRTIVETAELQPERRSFGEHNSTKRSDSGIGCEVIALMNQYKAWYPACSLKFITELRGE